MPEASSSGVRRERVVVPRSQGNLLWALLVCLGGASFLLASLSSYWGRPVLPLLPSSGVPFLPQGLVMGFYGVAGLFLGAYLWLVMLWDVGGGVNEFDKVRGRVSVFRWGFPGTRRRIHLACRLEDVEGIRLENGQGLSSSSTAFLQVRGRPPIPLGTQAGGISPAEVEAQAASLARFLGVSLEARGWEQ